MSGSPNENKLNNPPTSLSTSLSRRKDFKFPNIKSKPNLLSSENKRYSIIKEEINENQDVIKNPFDSIATDNNIGLDSKSKILLSRSKMFVNGLIDSSTVSKSRSKFNNIAYTNAINQSDIKFEIIENSQEIQSKYEDLPDNSEESSYAIDIDVDKILEIDKEQYEEELMHNEISSYKKNLLMLSFMNNELYSEYSYEEIKDIKIDTFREDKRDQIDEIFYSTIQIDKFETMNKIFHTAEILYNFKKGISQIIKGNRRRFSDIDRALAFCLIENEILFEDNNSTSLTILFDAVNKAKDEMCIAMLKIIQQHLESGQREKAYRVFVFGVCNDGCILNLICEVINEKMNNKKINHNNDLFLKICLFSKLFELNINISFGKNKQYIFDYNTTKKPILLEYSDFTFYALYSDEQINKISSSLGTFAFEDDSQLAISSFSSDNPCKKCSTNCDLIILSKSNITTKKVCENCLVSAIKQAIIARINSIEQHCFYPNTAYFLPLKIHNYFYLSNEALSSLFKQNFSFSNDFRLKFNDSIICSQCLQAKADFPISSCGCLYCCPCLLKLIETKTDLLYILNKFEKKTKKIECAKCGEIINDDSYKKNISLCKSQAEIKHYEKNAYERFIKLIEIHCAVCGKETTTNKLKVDNGVQKDHRICDLCKASLEFKSKKNETDFDCMFCDIKHRFNPLMMNLDNVYREMKTKEQIISSSKKKNRKKCCVIF